MTSLYDPASNGVTKNCSNCKHERTIDYDASTYCAKLVSELGIEPTYERTATIEEDWVKTADYFCCNFHEWK